jgi:hypothetical protein
MASGLYAAAKKAFLDGDIDLLNDDIRVQLIDVADYVVDLAAHDFLDDVAAAARVGTATALASKTTTAGVFDAADTVVSAVTGDGTEAVLVYSHTGGADSARRLIAYFDNAGVVLTPNGNDVTVQWDNGANKIFKI